MTNAPLHRLTQHLSLIGTRFLRPDHNLARNYVDQANTGAGRNRLTAPMITTTKNSSTMPCNRANAGPEGGLPGASAINAGILRKLWITSTKTFRYNEAIAVTT